MRRRLITSILDHISIIPFLLFAFFPFYWMFVVATNDAAQDAGIRANDLVGAVAAAVGGHGGGKADLAQSSGKDPAGIDAALAAVRAKLAQPR